MVKNPAANAGDLRDMGSVPGLGRSPRGGNGNPLQCPCLRNPMDKGACRPTAHRVTRSRTHLKQLSTHTYPFSHYLVIFCYSNSERHKSSLSLCLQFHLICTVFNKHFLRVLVSTLYLIYCWCRFFSNFHFIPSFQLVSGGSGPCRCFSQCSKLDENCFYLGCSVFWWCHCFKYSLRLILSQLSYQRKNPRLIGLILSMRWVVDARGM